jgi:imidazolonepropionase-like amidohydrolase
MKNQPAITLFTIFILCFFSSSFSANAFQQDTVSRGKFILHKFQQPIGEENYSIVKRGDSLKLFSDFKFNDRGQDVPLQTWLTLNKNGIPVYFKTKGKTSRTSVIDAEVKIGSDSAAVWTNGILRKEKKPSTYFTISGYSPVSVQMQLIKYWKQKNRPATVQVYPKGNLKIKLDGNDTVDLLGEKKTLERYFIKGLIWGDEIIWTDQAGELVALFTNDAEGDKFEAIQSAYLSSLPSFISKAASYGMANLKLKNNEKDNPVIALINGNVIDVISGNTIQNNVVLIENGVITKIGAKEKVEIPKQAKVIDLKGKSILPGLWDMHAHFQQVEWGPAYLAAGITTVRDCGNEFDFINSVQNAIDNNRGIGPKILKAGIIDGDSDMALGIIRVNKAEDAKVIVKKYKDAGFHQIKIYSSVKPDMIKAITTEAHKLGLSVTGHVPQGVSLMEAINLGQDQINHCTFVRRAMLRPDQKELNLEDSTAQKILQALKTNNIVVDPTLAIYEWILRPLEQPVDAFEPGVNYVSEDLKEIFRNTGMPAEEAKARKLVLDDIKKIVLAMHKMGITIVAGTDMMVPGFSLYRELELYHDAGLTPLEALQTATITPARVMKMEKESGSVAAGKKADLIIVDGNPLDHLSDIRKVTLVIKNGKIFNPSELRAIVDFKR